MPNLKIGALIIRSQTFHNLWKAGFGCPKSNAVKITFLCKVLAYQIESPSTPVNLNTTMTTGGGLLAHFPQFLL